METTIAVIGVEENPESIEEKLSVAGEIIKRGGAGGISDRDCLWSWRRCA